ncbi:SusC/RagA family TonB-linked outer membrane protein [Neolewinella sp.]|uniref:SusC/RagA family TonB-linked outer membrane protein n=1 Tax=Neolewinella sp. TaxID=2993543 RepID=UPI003B52C7EC
MKLNLDHAYRGCLFLLLVLFTSTAALAQTSVSGTITDADSGDPLIGASILVTGTSTGTVTDFDGNYTLNVPEGAESLTISYTGYATQTVPFTGQSTVDLALTSGELLDEVVVVGYGTVTQKQVTSAVTSIDSEDFNAGNINDPTQLIQGKVAGLTISKVGGNVNRGSTIRLRGLSSFGGNTSPLIIIDGVVGANLNTVDPADIESVNVLKDGSAAAIYGIQASSGVIIVTTKRGTEASQGQFAYRGYVSAEEIAKAPPVADRETYLRLIGQAADLNRAVRPTEPNLPTSESIRRDNDFGGNTNWIDEVTRTGVSHVHNLSYNGGGSGMTYRASVNYRDIKGIGVVNDGFRQINGRLSVTQRAFNDRLSVALDVTATDRDADIYEDALFRYAVTYNPTVPVMANDLGDDRAILRDRSNEVYGGFTEIENFDYNNPVAIARTTQRERQQTNILYSLRTSFDLTDDVALNLNYSRNRESGIEGYFAQRESRFGGGAEGGQSRAGNATRNTNDNRNDLFEATATYNTDFGSNSLELLAGYSWQQYTFQGFNAGGRGLSSNAFGFNALGGLNDIASGQINIGSYRSEYTVIGFFGRARLGIGTAYNVTASVRRDGTSRNGPENRWDIFPAISASADLVDAFSLNGPDQLKIRVGYGITGSIPPGNYDYLQTFGVGSQAPFQGVDNYVPTIGPNSNPNPNLRFEKKGEFNAGIDFAFLDYRLTGTLDYYIRNTGDLLFNAQVPTPPFQFQFVQANLNNVDLINTGVELSVGYSLGESGGFTYEPRLIFSTYNTRLEDTGETPDFNFGSGGELTLQSTSPGAPGQNGDPISRIRVGDDFGNLYARILDVEASRAAGTYVFVNQDGNVDEDGNAIIDEADKVIVGNGLPDFSLSMSNAFTYRNFDLSIFLRGDFGHDLANLPRNFYGQLGNAVSRPIDNLIVTDLLDEQIVSPPRFSNVFVEDASFLALDNAQLGYTFPLGSNTGFSTLRAYVAGQNLFYITNYSGVDPNVRFADLANPNNPNNLAPGIDRRNTYFRTRTFTAGIAVGF